MRFLLVRPPQHPDTIDFTILELCEPIELEYVASSLEAAGHRADILDMLIDKGNFERRLKRVAPDAVAFTGYITHVNVIKDLARRAKAVLPGIPVFVGGVHAEVVPQDFEDPAIDFVLRANGLKSIVEAAGLLGAASPAEIRARVAGVWDGPGKPYAIDKAFAFPHPDRTKNLHHRRRYHYIFRDRCALMKTSFGCAYSCDFCFCARVTGGAYFERPIEDAVDEIAGIAERNVLIVDDNFLFKRSRVLRFCELLDERGIDKEIIVFGRADFIARNPDVVARFRKSGLRAVFMGLESFKDEELEDLNKRVSLEENLKALEVLAANGVECNAGMITEPDWTREDFDRLIKYVRSFKGLFVNLQPLTPIPGTPVYDRYVDRLSEPRSRHELWDMAHLVVHPRGMSRRAYYANIVRAYFAITPRTVHRYVLRNYGLGPYLRTLIAGYNVLLQYALWILKG